MASDCSAEADASRRKIADVFDQTKKALGVGAERDWTRSYYQFANRVALLQHLVSSGTRARMLFIYFYGDDPALGSRGRDCPATEEGWSAAISSQTEHVGLASANPLMSRIHKLFLPAYSARIATRA